MYEPCQEVFVTHITLREKRWSPQIPVIAELIRHTSCTIYLQHYQRITTFRLQGDWTNLINNGIGLSGAQYTLKSFTLFQNTQSNITALLHLF